MLEKPDVRDEQILECLEQNYGLVSHHFAFLPVGADPDSAAYRLDAANGAVYFVKLRRGAFNEIVVTLPNFLSASGIAEIIPPVPAITGKLYVPLSGFSVIIYPFIRGRDGTQMNLTDTQWVELGAALKRIHSQALPPALRAVLPVETFSPGARDRIKHFLSGLDSVVADDPIAAELVSFLRTERAPILELVARTAQLAQALQSSALDFVPCHTDLHAGNLLISDNGAMFIVDWDAPLFAPRERDLMFIGGGQYGGFRTAAQEETLFYRGYGEIEPNPIALAYYRFERILQDIDVEIQEIWFHTVGDGDRARELEFLKWNFLPGAAIEIAYNAAQQLDGLPLTP